MEAYDVIGPQTPEDAFQVPHPGDAKVASVIDGIRERTSTSLFKTQVGGDHYTRMAIQPLEYALANNLPFAEGCIIKYLSRWRFKNGLEDLRKGYHMYGVLIASEEAKLKGEGA
jgi:hypothetical protein